MEAIDFQEEESNGIDFQPIDFQEEAPVYKTDFTSGPPPEEGLGGSFINRMRDIGRRFEPAKDEGIMGSIVKAPFRLLSILGQSAGFAGDIIGEGIKDAYNLLTPEETKKEHLGIVEGISKSWAGDIGRETINYWKPKWESLEEDYPVATGSLRDVTNLAMLPPIGKTAKALTGAARATGEAAYGGVVKPLGNIAEDLWNWSHRMPAAEADAAINQIVKKNVEKAIKPKVKGRSNAGLAEKQLDNYTTAIKDDIAYSGGVLPETVEDFSVATRKTKKALWDESHGMAAASGDKGAIVSTTPVRTEMTEILNARNVPDDLKKAAQTVLDQMQHYDDFVPPPIAEDLMAELNEMSKQFWLNRDPRAYKVATVAERANQKLRALTDKAIETYEGPGYLDLRKRYGAQTAIEKEVTDRATVSARSSVKGFFDLVTPFSTGEFVTGVLTANPEKLLRATVMETTKGYMKWMNNPNRMVRNMFKDVDTLLKRRISEPAKAKEISKASTTAGRPPIRHQPKGDKIAMEWAKPSDWDPSQPIWDTPYTSTPTRPPGGEITPFQGADWFKPRPFEKPEPRSILPDLRPKVKNIPKRTGGPIRIIGPKFKTK